MLSHSETLGKQGISRDCGISKIDNQDGLLINGLVILRKGSTLVRVDQLNVPRGRMIAIMGASGIGKTSLLHSIAGVLPSSFTQQGTINLNGRRIDTLPAEQRRVGLIFQLPLLFDHLNVTQNITFAMPPGSVTKRQQIVEEALEISGLTNVAHARVDKISRGQQSRVSMLRTLLTNPDLLLLDEPFANLDWPLRLQLANFLRERIAQQSLPSIIVTHDPKEANILNAAIWDIQPDGRLVASSAAQE